jgi:acyl-CoA synthetase (AMP-forming)/AMP-acid ligase II
MRTLLFADPTGVFLHDAILASCRRMGEKTAIVDTSCSPVRRVSYAEYGDAVERLARGLVAAGLRPGEVLAIYLPNSWEFCVAYHAATLAGAVPTVLNPSYREREVRYQLGNSGAAMLVTGGTQISGMNLSGLQGLRRLFCTRTPMPGCDDLEMLFHPTSESWTQPGGDSRETLAALPYSSGTTGLPKGVMLSHSNLVTNVYQFLAPGELGAFTPDDTALCFLPLYHIYGLNVILNPVLMIGATLVLMPRFDLARCCELITSEGATFLPLVPPAVNALCQAAEQGLFPREHRVRYVKSGAAPLAPGLARRFTDLTGVLLRQGYGMTEAAPVTHIGYIEPELYRPDSIGRPVAQTECRLVAENGEEDSHLGELVMRGPQFMLGYWRAPEATAEALRDGWYWTGDVASRDADDFYQIVDRRKEMIKYKGFAVAPAEVEAVLLEHPAVRDCGVIGRCDDCAGEVPCAFVVLRNGTAESAKIAGELCDYVAQRLTSYKQPREIRFVNAIPRNPSGKILRRELRNLI